MHAEIERLVREEGVTHFISGMALGVDTFAAELVLDMRERNRNITLEAAVPCETQAERWQERSKRRYKAILDRADKVTLVQKHYSPECMHLRNKYMVDHADVLLAVWGGDSHGGTGKTVAYAKNKDMPVICIDPETLCRATI